MIFVDEGMRTAVPHLHTESTDHLFHYFLVMDNRRLLLEQWDPISMSQDLQCVSLKENAAQIPVLHNLHCPIFILSKTQFGI